MKNPINHTIYRIKQGLSIPLLLGLAFVVLCSHDLFIKLDTYLLKPHEQATIKLYNGTFETSEAVITRDRILDASVIGRGTRVALDSAKWTDKDSTLTQLTFTSGEPGTYVAGVSTGSRTIALKAEKFNSYLEHDGIIDVLEQRRNDSIMYKDAIETYEKHVKAIYQVGNVRTEDWKTAMNYPIEFIPLANPYDTHTHDQLDVQLLLSGKPLANQLVYVNYIRTDYGHYNNYIKHKGDHRHNHSKDTHAHDHHQDEEHKSIHAAKKQSSNHVSAHKHQHGINNSHSHNTDLNKDHQHIQEQQLRTNAQGIVTVELPEDGMYYLRTIHMVDLEDNPEFTHHSKWATLSFEITHEPNHEHGTDEHDHDDYEEGIPNWSLGLISILIIVVLFFVFKKKN